MIVWGGATGGNALNTGGVYDPVDDSWKATSTAGVPSPKSGHRAVWTGKLMVVWGGSGSPYLDTGGRYDPVLNSWSPISHANAPDPINYHTSLWNGERMLVFPGAKSYDPVANVWTALPAAGSPIGRYNHTAIWTGSRMILWGGRNEGSWQYYTDGAQLIPGGTSDVDGDGYSRCQGDCDETTSAVHPGAYESCAGNGLDDDCDGSIDERADVDSDGTLDGCDNCAAQSNATQADLDLDQQGDVCDFDDGYIHTYRSSKERIDWQPEVGHDAFNLYLGSLGALRATGEYTQSPGSNPLADRFCGLVAAYVDAPAVPAPGDVTFSLVSGVAGGVEGSLGTNGQGGVRPNQNPCP
jgi:hypothetical protein